MKETLKRALVTRLRNSKQFLLILTHTTKYDTDWVPFEISYAVDNCKLPLILAYPGHTSILAPAELFSYWPQALKTRIINGSARAIHIPFRKEPVLDALSQFDILNTGYPTDGYGYYDRKTHQMWSLV